MPLATKARPGSAAGQHLPGPAPTRGALVERAAALILGAALLFVVGRDGSVLWLVARVVVVVVLAALTFRALPSSSARRGSAAFTAGLLGLAVAVGIGGPHLAKSGLTPMTVAGGMAFASGMVLLVTGGLVLVRASRYWWRALTVPALALVVLVVVWTLGQAIAATNVPRTAVGATTPADAGFRYRDVELRTPDGITLSGWYVPSTNGAAVVLLHGAGSTRSGVLDHAVVLARHGYGVLLFDARGHGRSGGRAMDFGWYGDEDAALAVSFLRDQPDVDDERIAAVGLSMGGEEAIGAAASDKRLRAVVAEGATNRVPGDKAWLADEFGWRGRIQQGIEWLLYNIADLLTAADQPETLQAAVAAAAPRPVLLIAGADMPDEPRAGRFIQEGSPATVQLWVAPDTGHTEALATHPAEWEARVTSFLVGALAGEGE